MSLTYNWTPANLTHWNAAKADVRSGAARTAYLACLLDSVTAGTSGANRAASYPTQLAAILNGSGLPAEADSFFGDAANYGAPYPVYDPRVSLPLPWAYYGPPMSLGGPMFQGSSGYPSLDFASGNPSDTYEAFVLGNSNFALAADGGADSVVQTLAGGPASMVKVVASAALGVHTWSIRPEGSTTFVVGGHAYSSQRPAVAVLNMGWGGATTTAWADASQTWSPTPSLATVAPKAVLIAGCRNNCPNTSLTQTAADLVALFATIRANGGDPMLVVLSQADPNAPGAIYGTASQQQAYNDLYYGLSAAHGVGLIDLTADSCLTSYATAVGAGLMSDGEHYNPAGYRHMASLIASVIGG